MREWDPLGVAEFPEARDEYDSYLALIADQLRRNASVDEIADLLHSIATREMGTARPRRLDAHTAAAVLRWYSVEITR